MRCDNTERGCQWTGTVGTFDNHVVSCQFALVPCPNKCEEDEGAGELLLIRRHLAQHLETNCPKRPHKCPYCGEKGTFASITDHDQVCEKKVVACPNEGKGCSLYMKREKTKEHVSSACEYTNVPCVYESLGCGVTMPRKDIVEHQENDDKLHLHLVLKSVSILIKEHMVLFDTVDIQHEEQLKTLSEGEAVAIQLPGFASKKEKNEIFFCTPFYTHPGGYKMCIAIYANGNGDGEGTHVSVFTKLSEGHYDNQLHWPFLGTVMVEVLNQLEDGNHYKKDIRYYASQDMRVGKVMGYTKFISHCSLDHNPATSTQYLLDDTLYFRVSVKVDNHKPWLVCSGKVYVDSIKDYKTLNNNAINFKVTNFKTLKASQFFFYTHPSGYRMRIEVDTNGHGYGKGKYVSIFTKLLDGRNDNELQWPFLGTVTYELLNQLENDNHHMMVNPMFASSDMRVGSTVGYHQFLSHSSLGHNPATNTQYLLDDTLYFRVTVKVDSHKPWLVCTN